MAWYQRRWWYVERPFPWLLIGVCAVVVALVLAVVGLAVLA